MFPCHETHSQLDGKLFPFISGLFACFEEIIYFS